MFGFLAMLSHLASAKLVLPAKVRPEKTCSWDNGIEEREHIMLFFELWNKRVYAFLCCPIVAWNVNNVILEQKYGTMQPNKGINFLFLCRVINLFFLTPHLLFHWHQPSAPPVHRWPTTQSSFRTLSRQRGGVPSINRHSQTYLQPTTLRTLSRKRWS
jgi:hypothetical protein